MRRVQQLTSGQQQSFVQGATPLFHCRIALTARDLSFSFFLSLSHTHSPYPAIMWISPHQNKNSLFHVRARLACTHAGTRRPYQNKKLLIAYCFFVTTSEESRALAQLIPRTVDGDQKERKISQMSFSLLSVCVVLLENVISLPSTTIDSQVKIISLISKEVVSDSLFTIIANSSFLIRN